MVNICRLCAAVRKVDMLTTIADTNHELCLKLRKCCQVEIRMSDRLPKCVCCDCVAALQQAYDFYLKVHESQESLATLFAPTDLQSKSLALTSPKNDFKSEVINDTQDAPEAEVHVVQAEESQAKSAAHSEDDVDLILKNGLEEELDDEVYLIEKILGRRCREDSEEGLSCEGVVTPGTDEMVMSSLEDELDEKQQPQLEESREDTLLPPLKRSKLDKLGTVMTNEDQHRLQNDEDQSNLDKQSDEAEAQVLRSVDVVGNSQSESWASYRWCCYLCGAEESAYLDLLLHLQVVHDLMSSDDLHFKCIDCQKICKRYNNFVNHVRLRHRPALALCCDVCSQSCSDCRELALHRDEQHSADSDYPKLLLCGDCGRAFLTPNCLQIHSKLHANSNEVFECGDCGKQFKQAKGLKTHSKVHTGAKDFSCDQCGKSFHQKVNLEVHMMTHSTDKPYACAICQKSFKTPTSLDKHSATHTDIKKFKCDYCGNLFRTKDSKVTHERIHTGERPYKCQHCPSSFRFRGTFLAHMNTHTGRRPYSCVPCNHHFTNWSNYNKHMKRRHGDQYVGSATGKKKVEATQPTQAATEYVIPEDVEESTDSAAAETIVYSVPSTNADEGFAYIEISQSPEAVSDVEKITYFEYDSAS